MKRLLCPSIPAAGRPVALSEQEAHHAIQVLRLREGDRVQAIDGRGAAVFARIRLRGGAGVRLELDDSEPASLPRQPGRVSPSSVSPVPVVLEMAVLKGEAMEWVVEKAVELGVKALLPVLTERTVVQMDRKGPEAFRERWQRIADQALKQCGRLERMEVLAPVGLEGALLSAGGKPSRPLVRLWCDESQGGESRPLVDFLLDSEGRHGAEEFRILIGPEGGWTDRERELLSRSSRLEQRTIRVDLGPFVLRAETAAISALSITLALLRTLWQPASDSG